MYSRNRVGIVVPVREKNPDLRDLIDSIPLYIDQIYLVGNGNSSDLRDFVHLVKGDPRFSVVITKTQPDGDLVLAPAFQKAIEEQMDVVAVMSGSALKDATYLPSLLDPIVWGRADLTKLRCPIEPPGASRMQSGICPELSLFQRPKSR